MYVLTTPLQLLVSVTVLRLKGHDQNVSAYSRRSVNSGGVVNLTFTYVYVRTYVVGAYWIAALCNLISTP